MLYPLRSGVHFDIDIMNPHFSQYYTGSEFPTDFQSPNPIYFLTLKGTRFQFLIVAQTAPLLILAKNWFDEAIANQGFGAKSAVGYGYFRELNDKTDELKYEFAEKLSLDDAYNIYSNQPDQRDTIYIDLGPLVDYFPKFAVIITENICEVESIGGIDDIPELVVEADAGIVIPSEFGNWVYEKTKARLFEKELPAFPNLVYRGAFKNTLSNLSPSDCERLQEKLLEISSEFYYLLGSFSTERREELQYKMMEIQEGLQKNRILPDMNDHRSLIDKLEQIIGDLENEAGFVNLSSDNRALLQEQLQDLLENHGDVADQWTFLQRNWFYITLPDMGRIECGGIEHGKLVLRNYRKQQ